jgi:hypothetical protein
MKYMSEITGKDVITFLFVAAFVSIILSILHPAIAIHGLPAGVIFAFTAIAVGIILTYVFHHKKINIVD